jgi:transcriptional regulator with XRE-family HTH domain
MSIGKPGSEAAMAGIAGEVARISRRIRRLREVAGLTLQQLAQRSDLATSTVHKVESGQMTPSVAVLLKIARGLGRSATELIQESGYAADVVHTTAAQRTEIGLPRKMRVERLSADLRDPALEMWRVTLYPGVSSGKDAIQYDGEELVLCEAGCVTFRLGDAAYVLRVGDALHFKASIPHSWRNAGKAVARFTVTGTLPGEFRALIRSRVAKVTERRAS